MSATMAAIRRGAVAGRIALKAIPPDASERSDAPHQPPSAKRNRHPRRHAGRLGPAAGDTIPIALARHLAGSLNPASMRSRLRLATASVPRDLTEASRFPDRELRDS